MTGPLIDRAALRKVLWRQEMLDDRSPVLPHVERTTDAVLAYLRSVLTPEALYPYAPHETAIAMLRRIFGA